MTLRKLLPCLLLIALIVPASLSAQENNDFYDNVPLKEYPCPKIEIAGEVVSPGPVDLSPLPLRQVLVREAILKEGKETFVGSYVFQGYSLFDILKERFVAKKNAAEFPSVIDLFVVVENGKGEKALFSWGEIFYPITPHRILVAVKAAPIIPSLTKEVWPLPDSPRVVAADDLFSERTVDNPTKITVLSAPMSFKVEKGKSPMNAPAFSLVSAGKTVALFKEPPTEGPFLTMPSVFYGRGKGFHGVTRFSGRPLRSALEKYLPPTAERLRHGCFIVASDDGYRVVFSYSELFNRTDNGEFLLLDKQSEDGGRFTIYPSPDFFSDRAVKSVKEIHYWEF